MMYSFRLRTNAAAKPVTIEGISSGSVIVRNVVR